jgi:hypothetical protein
MLGDSVPTEEIKLIERIARKTIKSDGKLYGRSEEKLRCYDRIMELLSNYINGFKSGNYTTTYIPLAYPIKDFAYHLKAVLENDNERPEKIYIILTRLLKEFQVLKTPIHLESLRKATSLFIDVAKPYGKKAYEFVDRYMAINKETLIDIARILIEHGSIQGCIDAIRSSFEDRGYTDLSQLLELKVGKHKDDKLIKRIYSIARYYDSILIIFGAACHYARADKLRKQYASHILTRTPFTRTFIDVLLGNVSVKDYIEAYKNFVECVASNYPAPLSYVVSRCAERLAEWKYIGIETEYFMETPSRTIYAIINDIFKGATY